MYKKEEIQIKRGNSYKNKTKDYLLPSLKLYGNEFIINLMRNQILAVGVSDRCYTSEDDDCIYVLIDIFGKWSFGQYLKPSLSRMTFFDTLEYLKDHESFRGDYIFQKDFHMFKIQLPIPDLKKLFLNGNYSKMYSEQDVESIIKKKDKIKGIEVESVPYGTITKSLFRQNKFRASLEEEFRVKVNYDISDREYDFKPLLINETFNYNKGCT